MAMLTFFKLQPLKISLKEKKNAGSGTRRRAEKQERKHLALEAYRLRFIKALDAELHEEMQEMKERSKGWSRKRLEDEGYALFDLSVRMDGHLFKTRIFRFFREFGNGILPRHHQFSQGDMVSISNKNPDDDSLEGVVMERAQRFLRIAVQWNASNNLKSHDQWRLDLSANAVCHERCTLAVHHISSSRQELDKVTKTNGNNGFVSSGEAASAVKGLIFSCGHEDSEIVVDSQEIHLAAGLPTRISGGRLGSFKGSYRKLLKEVDLNPSQKAAIEAGLCRRVTLWQGPPGTGKTRTLVQFIVIHCKTGQGKVLACADSNVAVDNLLEGILAKGLRVVRVGQPVKVKENLRAVTLEAQISSHPLMKKCIELRELAKERHSRRINSSNSLWEQSADIEARAIQDIISSAEVVAATCVGAGDPILDGHRFTSCVIDEATQATEPASLIPLLRSGADSFVLVGDPAQLPPTVVSKDATENGLQVSLFEHLQNCGLTAFLLDTQYRMHPALAEFPSNAFYEGRLVSQPQPSDRQAPEGFHWPNMEEPLAFVDCRGEELVLHDNSCQNRMEALEVVEIVKLLMSGGDIEGGSLGIGVIAPYSAQVRLLQDLFSAELGDHTKLEVKSVDGFQGREKEVIVVCTVRSNDQGKLGFVSDPRRMNVALTRARRGVVVVGSSSTLQSSCYWRMWLKEIRAKNLFLLSDGNRSWNGAPIAD